MVFVSGLSEQGSCVMVIYSLMRLGLVWISLLACVLLFGM